MMYQVIEDVESNPYQSGITTAATAYAGQCPDCGREITQTSHRCQKWISAPALVKSKPYALADNIILKQEQSRRDVEAKRKQLRGKRK